MEQGAATVRLPVGYLLNTTTGRYHRSCFDRLPLRLMALGLSPSEDALFGLTIRDEDQPLLEAVKRVAPPKTVTTLAESIALLGSALTEAEAP